MATTTNYGWTTPDDTALVKDGASAIRALGSAIDTSMNTALGTKKAGLVLLNTTSFSAVASQSVNSVFSSTYNNYQFVLNITAAVTASAVALRLRASSTDSTASVYGRSGYYNLNNSTTVTGAGNSGQTSWNLGSVDPANPYYHNVNLDIYNVFLAQPTTINFASTNQSSGNPFFGFHGAYLHTASTSYDGFTIFTDAGTMTGTVRVYGYNQ